jgi:tetratricopeptide (TPR) repeat protein
MAETRLEQLTKFYEEDPNDPFNIYGLALEYLKTDVKKSDELFNKLLTSFPDYLPAYYHAAKLKATLHQNDEALLIYQKGIEVASRLAEHKTKQELQSAYNELLFELE